jgi:hypothetical protein
METVRAYCKSQSENKYCVKMQSFSILKHVEYIITTKHKALR